MYYSRIQVQYRDGSKPKGARVVLSFGGVLGGVTKPAFTDGFGVALVEHATQGHADVIIGGKTCGSLRAPGETVVFV